ncbi:MULTISPECIES: DUF1697 domain-containing protein [unclassified Sphingomonas]|uniref:DUF1697 domain-containing protein n=1 Tax=unclassified Sphingomonas TaxID=196159 RepID=UPI00092764E0|nr:MULTISPECIES: DUF1697 domain-containing protein [unclassified Sphingomonas]MBN8849570.1 DUF1697 domain-containing protein [Sphingomonas sp.]OJV31067.1 MAG: hypothetical protein BGO24_17730 [Sphingomonas sp. 67-36]
MRWAALLKSINAGKNVAMADLRDFLSAQGMRDVATLLASGNALFYSDERDAAALEQRLQAAAREQLGLDTDWFLRGHDDLAAIAAANPFPAETAARPNHVQVFFLHQPVDPAVLEALAGCYDGPERLVAVGRELFVDYPAGIGRSKLPPAMARAKFPKAATARNWNTLLRLVALTA